MNFLFAFFGTLFSHVWNIFTDAILDLFDRQDTNVFNAEFGKETLIGSRYNKGFVISKHRKLTRLKSFENFLLCGNTGSGKTVRYLLKNLYNARNQTVIVNDPSGELHNLTSGYLAKRFKILTLNFSDAATSCGFNALKFVKKSSDLDRIAQMLVSATLERGGNADPYWSLQSISIIKLFLKLVKYQPEEQQHFASVLRVIDTFAADPEKVDRWIVATGDEQLILSYKSLVKTPEKTLQNCISSARAAMSMFENEDFARVTSHNSIDLENLRKEPTVLYLHGSISEKKYTSVLNGIFFEVLCSHLLQKLPNKKDLDVALILEECSSMFIPILPVFLANNRKARIATLICIQQPSQLETLYSKDHRSIYENCNTKVFLPGLTSLKTLQELELLSGKATVSDKNGRDVIRPLITVDQLRMLPKNRALLVHSNLPYILVRTSPYYRSWFTYLRYSKIPPVPLQGGIPEWAISYIS